MKFKVGDLVQVVDHKDVGLVVEVIPGKNVYQSYTVDMCHVEWCGELAPLGVIPYPQAMLRPAVSASE